MKLRDYQSAAINELLHNLPHKSCLLGLCTGGGKTFTAHRLIAAWLKRNPGKRVLVLTHNQLVLRKNFLTGGEGFTEVTKSTPTKTARGAQVIVALPATVKDKDIGKFGLLVFDEAHEFFDKPMVSKIREKIGRHQLLLLTASHGSFKSDEYHKVLYSVMEGFDDGYLSNAKIEIISTAWNFTDSNYTVSDDLNSKYQFSAQEVDAACKAVIKKMATTERSKGREFKIFGTKVAANIKLSKTKKLPELPKTLLACHNVEMADMIYDWFRARYPGQVLISYSDSTSGRNADSDSEAMDAFKDEQDKRLLIVVRRGILGFDCPGTEYVIDMTATKNVDRTTQLLGRVLRRSSDLKKHYFKVVPDYLENFTWYQMGAVVALFHPDNNRTWAGQANQVPIVVKAPDKKSSKAASEPKQIAKKKPARVKIPQAIINFEEYRHIFEKSPPENCEWLRSERYTTLQCIKAWGGVWNATQNKKNLLMAAKSGESKPTEKTNLGQALRSYTTGGCYDKEFDDIIRKLRPDWFFGISDRARNKKGSLLDLAKSGAPRPSGRASLDGVLRCYVDKKSSAYDADFTKQIQALRPDWFIKRNDSLKKKQELLHLAKMGGTKPGGRTSLGRTLGFYTRGGACYDREFTKKIRRIRPDWFITQFDRARQKKEELLLVAKSGDPRPAVRATILGNALCGYTNKNKGTYDPEFDKKIRKLRPDWFRKGKKK